MASPHSPGHMRRSSNSVDEMIRFGSVEEFVKTMGGNRVIKKILMANNGMAATKGLRSVQQWSYEMFGDSRAIKFVVMATPEDVNANVEYIKMADECVEVPGGSNRNNYANVDLIVDIAQRTKCDAVYVGWGHASENPAIPDRLAGTSIVFLGPPAGAMRALGDKISSTVVAQSADVPCIRWSGSHVVLPPGVVAVDDALYSQCCVKDLEQCRAVAEKVGFPLMIKASEGGGGKGIRMVKSMAGVADAYLQCCAEIPGSPIFLMQLATGCRHLEVQLLADKHGGVTSLKTRDCSVQRRHQKIIEEGPVLGTKDGVLGQMERAAVRLARLVGYEGVGTVEFLYEKVSGNFYFLELNPRLQVEHPVTEMITNINIPACIIMMGMGIRLQRMPDVRRFYGREPYGEETFDLDEEQMPNVCHTIAVRITAENPDESFRPTSGKIYSIDFKPSRTTWGYFSVATPGGVHEFADSQFGHIFASGESRETARKGMVVALSQLRIEGEIRTTYEYVMNLLERPEFINCDVSTSWLDGLLTSKERISQPIPHITVICGAIHKMNARVEKNQIEYFAFLQAGHAPSSDLLGFVFSEVLILNNVKYTVKGYKLSPTHWDLELNGSHVRVQMRVLNDRGVMVYLGRESYLTTAENDPNGLRVVVNGKTAQFTNDEDPCSLRTTVPGKLVRYLVSDGDFIESGNAYAEIEVMKMILQLKTNISGTVSLKAVAGTAVNAGKVLAHIEPLDGTHIIRPDEFAHPWPSEAFIPRSLLPDALSDMKDAVTGLYNIVCGYKYPPSTLETEVRQYVEAVCRGCDASLRGLGLPFLDVPADPNADADRTARLVHLLAFLLGRFWAAEEPFDGQHEDVALLTLCRKHAGNLSRVADIMTAHVSQDKVAVATALAALAEAKGLVPRVKEVLERIARLSSLSNNRIVLQARHLLRRMHLPSFDEMVAELRARFLGGVELKDVLYLSKYTSRMVIALLRDSDPAVCTQALDLLVRRNYNSFELQNIEIVREQHVMRARWSHALNHSVDAAFSHSLAAFSDMGIGDDGNVTRSANKEWGLMYVFRTIPLLLESFDQDVMRYMVEDEDLSTSPSVVEIMVGGHEGNTLDPRLEALMAEKAADFAKTGCQRITFRLGVNSFFTFRAVSQFKEDLVFRDVAPTLAVFLELSRLSYYSLETYPLRGRGLRLYYGRERPGLRMLPLPPKDQDRRFFLRMLALPERDEGPLFTENSFEYLISQAIQIVEVAMTDSKYTPAANHLFINFIEQTVTMEAMERHLALLQRYLKRLHKLYVTDIELKFTTPAAQRVRIFISNPSGHVPHIERYYEKVRNWKLLLEPVDPDAPSGAPLHRPRTCPSDPHPLLTAVDRKRLATQRIGTTYVYDWPETFDVCVKEMWAKAIVARPDHAALKEAMPPAAVVARELVLEHGALGSKPVSDCNNTCGMVCWEFDVYLPTRYDPATGVTKPKKLVVVANDISFQSGSFAIEEDAVFAAAGQRAVALSVPFVYLASNSGARIGMAQEVKDVYRVMFTDPDRPEKGFEYLYVEETDYLKLSAQKAINAEATPCPHTGRTVYRLKDVIGVKDGLGVENLSGSGLIAGQMSACYAAVPTLSLTSGRSVGIGAYLNRLGRRVVQVAGSPMILTGAAALNKLLGREIYKSNNQLGGCPVMSPNGVTHWEVADDHAGCDTIVRWLDLIPDQAPARLGDIPPFEGPQFQVVPDPWDRDVTYAPAAKEVADPRLLLTGTERDSVRLTGLFDADSWQEALAKWATTVIAGRAKLGGYPVGVIAVETRTQEKILPADPADPTSIATVRSQAGNVWFPDSARKTADAIQDFQREGLPCFILANWRGFSGGQRDMFDEVLKFGASIVDNLRQYDQPVFIYLPPYGDLRGGAWVVLDSKINAESIEMYADETSHAGVLEPSGLIEVKYRDTEIAQTMHRLDPVCSAIFQQLRGRSPSSDPDGPPSPLYPPETKKEMQQRLRAREELLMPLYRSVATELAALHDTPGRMLAKGAIRGVVEWRHARRFFFHRMLRRKWEGYALRALQCANPTVTLADTRARLSEWSGGLTADAEVAAWCQAHNTALAQNLLEAQQELLATRILAECGATAGSSTSAAPAMLLRVLHHLKASGADVAAIQAWAAAL